MNGNTAPNRKHVPLRSCVICREKDAKRTLFRVVRSEEGVSVDPSGKLNGRGAYLCERKLCWERAVSGDVLAKALRVTLTDTDRERLRQAMP
jgi:uncharacterized protein